jgi:hypothetical protein
MEDNMPQIARWLAVGAALMPSAIYAQSSDGMVCNQLVALNHAGLYIAYPSPTGQPDVRPVSAAMQYDPAARFFYVPGFGPRLVVSKDDEGLWHVRTRTRSQAPQGTDSALVYRPPVRTRCSPNSALPAFDDNTQFVNLRGYENFHAEQPTRSPSTALHTNFHLRIKDKLSPEVDGCTWTDDRSAFRLAQIYSFEVNASSRTASSLDPLSAAVAATEDVTYSPRFDGLSSEFAYDSRESGQPACFGFTMALPTNGLARSWSFSKLINARTTAATWRPVSTEILIKRIRGRSVLSVKNVKVTWR